MKQLSPEEAAAKLARLISRECRVDIFPPDLLRLCLEHAAEINSLRMMMATPADYFGIDEAKPGSECTTVVTIGGGGAAGSRYTKRFLEGRG